MFLQDSREAIQNCWIGTVRSGAGYLKRVVYLERVVVPQLCTSCTVRMSHSSFPWGLDDTNAMLGIKKTSKEDAELMKK